MQPSYRDYIQRNKRRLVVILSLLFIGVVGLLLYQAISFRIVGTNPGVGKVTYISPFFKVSFNHNLSKDNLSVSTPDGLIKNYSIEGNTLVFTFDDNVPVNKTYTIKINRVESQQGRVLTDKSFTFTTQSATFESLPKDQQAALVAAQDKVRYTAISMPGDSLNSLLSYGVSSDQVYNLKQSIYGFSLKEKTQFTSIEVPQTSIVAHPYDPNSQVLIWSVTFDLKANDKTYAVSISSSDTESLVTQISDTSGDVLFTDTKTSPN